MAGSISGMAARAGGFILIGLTFAGIATGYAITLILASSYLFDPQHYFAFFGDRDPAGDRKLVTILHVAPGLIALLAGPLQFIPAIRAQRPWVHRLTGWLYILAVATSLVSAFRLIGHTYGGWANGAGFTGLIIMWFCTTGAGLALAVRGQHLRHRRWMIRSYAITCAAVSLRFQLGFLTGLVGMSFDRAYAFVAWTSWVPLVLLTEIWLRRPAEAQA